MNSIIPSPIRFIVVLLGIAVIALAVAVPQAAAADAAPAIPAVLPALDMMEIVHNRARLIQFSIVAVAVGIALLWWGNKTH